MQRQSFMMLGAASVVLGIYALDAPRSSAQAAKERVAFSPDGKTLASVISSLVADKALWLSCEVKLRDMATGKVKTILKGTQGRLFYPSCVAFSPDGKTLVCGCQSWYGKGEVIVWDFNAGTEKARLTSCVNSVAFSPDSKTLATGGVDEPIKLWDVASGKERTQLQGHTKSVWSVGFSPNGKILASGSANNSIKLWDVATGKELSTLKAHIKTVSWSCLAFSPDGKTLASASWDKTVKLWDMPPSR